ncbi:helix-turn-helix transcriptional regulator [Streptosporangium sp. NPDC051023]|uniref:helix-turn-helix transcriptional regulator n=1 Tax=Streptosporangium sp. NPDC051023 TaxID=3155410 RepID=UPI00344D60CE
MTDNRTPLRPIRVEDELWIEFGRLAGERKRSTVIRDFIRWYIGAPGAKLPARPGEARPKDLDEDPELMELLKRARNEVAHNLSGRSLLSSKEEEALSPMELQVLLLIAEGWSEAATAERLAIGVRTVKTLIRDIATKIRSTGRVLIYSPIRKRNTASGSSAES